MQGGWAGTSGASNFPLRGSKTSDFEGGVRTVAFLAGGYLPAEVRGGTHTGYISVADWYGTLCRLVGVDPEDNIWRRTGRTTTSSRQDAGGSDGDVDGDGNVDGDGEGGTTFLLPPVDSNDFWPSILVPNASSSGRDELWLSWSCAAPAEEKVRGVSSSSSSSPSSSSYSPGISSAPPRFPLGCDPAARSVYNTSLGDPTAGQGRGDMAYIAGRWKIVVGQQNGRGVWSGPVYPNGTADGSDFTSCVDGCLFDIVADPTEHANRRAAEPAVWAAMVAKLLAASKTLYQTDYAEPGADHCITGEQARRYYRGHNTCDFGGPGFRPSRPGECDETVERPYLGPMCFKELPPGMPPPAAAAQG